MRIHKFHTQYRAGKSPVDWVSIGPDDEPQQYTPMRIKDINADLVDLQEGSASHDALRARWEIIKPRYEAWKRDEELPEGGTPLAAWAGLSPDQVKALKSEDIRTVEDIAMMGEAVCNRLGFPSARTLPKLAQEYLDGQTAAEKDAQIAALTEKMAAMEAVLEETLNEKAAKKPAPAKRPRGRPKKKVDAS